MNKEEITYKDCVGINTIGKRETNYLQVIEGTEMYYKWYVDALQSQLTKSNNKIEKIKEYINAWKNSKINVGMQKIIDYILSIIDGSDE